MRKINVVLLLLYVLWALQFNQNKGGGHITSAPIHCTLEEYEKLH